MSFNYNNYDSFTDEEDDLSDEMEIQMLDKTNKENLDKVKGTNIYLNSVNVFVGRQRSGKTYSMTKEIIKLTRNSKETHLIIYINKDGDNNDETFNRLTPLIETPIIYVSYREAPNLINSLIKFKGYYNKIKDNGWEDEAPDNVRNEIFEKLFINDFNLPFLHTVIILEDATNTEALKNQTSIFNDLMTKCRHIQCSFYVLVHYWKALSTNLKSNLSTIFIFGGYSRQQLQYITYQLNLSLTSSELWGIYKNVNGHDKLYIDSINQTYDII